MIQKYIYIILLIIILLHFSNSFLKETYANPEIEVTPYTNNIKNRILFILWTCGKLSKNRLKNINKIKKNSKCNVILIDNNNINDYILKEYPLHKGYNYLSCIHKADYLRCYLMHHYGGGYSDIKEIKHSWIPAFKEMENNKHIWANGVSFKYGIFGLAIPEEYDKEKRKHIRKYTNNLIGIQSFIYKPRTKLTYDWYNLLNKRMDYYYEKLKENPAKYPRESASGTPKPIWEGGKINTKYPISWNRILGQINYPLQIKYINNIKQNVPIVNHKNYK